jgi:cytochrome c-type biogenesis protein CcmH/NrfG
VRDAWQAADRRQFFVDELRIQAWKVPGDRESVALLGARLAEVQRYDEADYYLGRAEAQGLHDERLTRVRAASLVALGRREAAKALLDAPGAPPTVRRAAERLQALPGKATPLEQAAAICPEGPAALTAQFARGSWLNGVSDWLAGRNPEQSGFGYRERLARENPADPTALTLFADGLRRNGFLRDAETTAQKATQLAPDSAAAYLVLGDVLLEGASYANASNQYRKALNLASGLTDALVGLGRAAMLVQANDMALDRLGAVVRTDPGKIEAWIALGRAYFRQGMRYDKSLEAYANAQKLAPDRTDFYPYYADSMVAAGRFDDAEKTLRRRLDAVPRDAMALYALAGLLINQQRTTERAAEAELLLRRSLEIEPDVPAAQVRLAGLLLEKEGPEVAAEAGSLLADALEATPWDSVGLRLAAQAYRRIGKPEKARQVQQMAALIAQKLDRIRVLEERELKHPTEMPIHTELARLYAEVGKASKAQRQQEVIYLLKNDPEKAAQGLRRLLDATAQNRPSATREPAPTGSPTPDQRGVAPGDTSR